MRRLLALLGGLAACGHPDSPRPIAPGPGSAMPVDAAAASTPTSDAPEPSQEERLAAIQKAMNELDEAVQACWAAAATERFDIEGDLVAQIEIGERSGAQATTATKANVGLVRDTARTPRLSACVVAVLASYPWAPPLRGQTIQLPFQFRAPNGQNVIDRALVSAVGQGDLRVSVLLDENNSGNAMASLVEVALASGGTTGMRRAERAELWFFTTPAELHGPDRVAIAVAAGDMVYVPQAGVREIVAKPGAVSAMLAIVPGGREGAARAGALPTPEAASAKTRSPAPILLAAKEARRYPRGPGMITIFAEPSKRMTAPTIAATLLEFPAGMAVPEHVHAKETELLYVLAGAGTLTLHDAGRTKPVELAVTATSVVQIPPGTKHAFTATQHLRAVQIYTPAGPEQRFKVK